VIESISPSSPAASADPQTIFLIGNRLIPGTVTAISSTGRTVTANASQPSPNPFGKALDQTLRIDMKLEERGVWTLRHNDIRNGQSNTFVFTVR
jgi:hypothetical protein